MTFRTTLASALTACAILSLPYAVSAAGQTEITDEFCNTVQKSIMSNTVEADTAIHPDWDAFLESKASVDPLRNEQFTTFGPDGDPRMISCKFKSADHIREVYGEDAAAEEPRSCEAINRENVQAVLASLTPEEQARLAVNNDQIVFEEDETVFMGVKWVAPFNYVWTGEEGALHIKSKRLQVDWTNLLFRMAPEAFRGALYCHLIAPEYVKALVLGEADVPPPVEE